MAPTARPVILHLPADLTMLRVARVTVASVAAALPFTLQDIEDLRVAVDELAAAAVEGCDPALTLELEIVADGESVNVVGAVPGAGPMPELHAVAIELLRLVAPDHELGSTPQGRSFQFTKRASVVTP